MAFGYIARNNSNNVLLSDQAYSCVYIGKATAGQRFTNNWTRANSAIANFNPLLQIQVFSIDGRGKVVIPFIHVTSGYTSILWYEVIGTVYRFYVAVQFGVKPTVYCFANSISLGKSGWGLSLYDANGNITFNSQDKILIPRLVYNAVTSNSRVFYDDRYQRNTFWAYSLSGVTTNKPLNPLIGTIAKPAIMYFAYGTAECYSSVGYSGRYWESCASYSNGNLLTTWGTVTVGANTTTQTPARDEIAIVIDGAQYD